MHYSAEKGSNEILSIIFNSKRYGGWEIIKKW